MSSSGVWNDGKPEMTWSTFCAELAVPLTNFCKEMYERDR